MRPKVPVRKFEDVSGVKVSREATKREMLLEQLRDLGVSTFKAQSIENPTTTNRQKLIEASEFELEQISRRKETYKDSEFFPESKYFGSGANYEPEVRKSIADDLADQDEENVAIGDKTAYRGAFYRTGQPWIIEGDAKTSTDLHRAADAGL